jgi:hypothetical protein
MKMLPLPGMIPRLEIASKTGGNYRFSYFTSLGW